MTPRLSVFLILGILLVACGGSDKTHSPEDKKAPSDAPQPTAEQQGPPSQQASMEPAKREDINNYDHPTMERGEDGLWVIPGWAKDLSGPLPEDVSGRTFVQRREVFIGVPEEPQKNDFTKKGELTDCFQFEGRNSGRRFNAVTFHTNAGVCTFAGLAFTSPEGFLVVREINRSGEYETTKVVDAKTKETVIGPTCHLKIARENGGFRIDEDWPNGCSSRRCDDFGTMIGSSFAATSEEEPCKTVIEAQNKTIGRLRAGETPKWAEDLIAESDLMTRYGGVWQTDTEMDVNPFSGEEDEQPEFVTFTDTLYICQDKNGRDTGSARVHGSPDHECNIDGELLVNARGDLLLKKQEPSKSWDHRLDQRTEGPPCHLRITASKNELKFAEDWPEGCSQYYCGARAMLIDAVFKNRTTRKPTCRPEEVE